MAVVSYKCPCCGAGIAFDSEKQLFKCEYCLSEFTQEQLEAQTPKADPVEEERTSAADSDTFCENLLSYTCNNCGAEVFADADTVADFCYYCHNPVVCNGRLSGQLKPNKIIPFAFDKAEAEKRFLTFARKKRFVPKDFFSAEHADQIRGVYFPFWLTDADVSARLSAKAQKVRTWTTGNKQYTETSHYALFRAGDIHFEDVTTAAYSAENKQMLEGILPFPSDALRDFSMTYLSGFLAKKRNIEHESIAAEVKQRINGYSEQLLMKTTDGYSSVQPSGTQTDMNTLAWDYALMPIWILTYVQKKKDKEKIYTYALNGHTGKIYGELPLSAGRLFGLFAGLAAGITFVWTLVQTLMGGFLFW